MTSYQADPETVATQSLSSNEMINELIEETTGINHGGDSNGHRQPGTGRERDGQPNRGKLCLEGYGSVEVFVQLTGLADEDTFTVWSSVLKLLPMMKRLMRRLLEMNWSGTFEACFGILTTR